MAATIAPKRYSFEPEEHAAELDAIIGAIESASRFEAGDLENLLRRHPKDGRGFFSKSELIHGYRALRPGSASEKTFVDRVRDEAGADPQRRGAGDRADEALPLPGPLHLLPERRADAEELSVVRTRGAAGRGASVRPFPADPFSSAFVPPHGPCRGQGRADRARRHLVELPGGVSALVRAALLRGDEPFLRNARTGGGRSARGFRARSRLPGARRNR